MTDAAARVLIEHVSVHNSGDGNIDITRNGTRDITVAWSVLASPADTEKNMLIAFGPTRVFLHHNLFIASRQRNPQVTYDDSIARSQDSETTLDMRNNLLWDWRRGFGSRIRYGRAPTSSTTTSRRRAGTARDALIVCRGLADDSACSGDTTNVARAYVRGNVSADGVDIDGRGTEATPFPAPPVSTDDPRAAACAILARAGARPLDALDQSYLATVRLACVTPPPPVEGVRLDRSSSSTARRASIPSRRLRLPSGTSSIALLIAPHAVRPITSTTSAPAALQANSMPPRMSWLAMFPAI